MDILKEYAKKEAGGYWVLKPIMHLREDEHSSIIGQLAELGDKQGYNVWVGLKEQNDTIKSAVSVDKPLSDFCKPKALKLVNLSADQLEEIRNIDLIWYKEGKIQQIFEVENSTAMTEALRRASTIPYETKKYMILPDERVNQLAKKMRSPMFGQWFEPNKWQVLYYDSLRNNTKELKSGKKQLDALVGILAKQASKIKPKAKKQSEQLGLL
jgi:hypothetical protein